MAAKKLRSKVIAVSSMYAVGIALNVVGFGVLGFDY